MVFSNYRISLTMLPPDAYGSSVILSFEGYEKYFENKKLDQIQSGAGEAGRWAYIRRC